MNHPNRQKVADWAAYLTRFREKHSLTQKQLAHRLSVSIENVQNWEQGRSSPPRYLKMALEYMALELNTSL